MRICTGAFLFTEFFYRFFLCRRTRRLKYFHQLKKDNWRKTKLDKDRYHISTKVPVSLLYGKLGKAVFRTSSMHVHFPVE